MNNLTYFFIFYERVYNIRTQYIRRNDNYLYIYIILACAYCVVVIVETELIVNIRLRRPLTASRAQNIRRNTVWLGRNFVTLLRSTVEIRIGGDVNNSFYKRLARVDFFFFFNIVDKNKIHGLFSFSKIIKFVGCIIVRHTWFS